MKKVFIVSMEAYDDFGTYLGTTIIDVYTTLEIAQKRVDQLKEAETTFIDYQYSIEESVLREE